MRQQRSCPNSICEWYAPVANTGYAARGLAPQISCRGLLERDHRVLHNEVGRRLTPTQ